MDICLVCGKIQAMYLHTFTFNKYLKSLRPLRIRVGPFGEIWILILLNKHFFLLPLHFNLSKNVFVFSKFAITTKKVSWKSAFFKAWLSLLRSSISSISVNFGHLFKKFRIILTNVDIVFKLRVSFQSCLSCLCL